MITTRKIIIGLDIRKEIGIKAKDRITNAWAKSDHISKVKLNNWTTVPRKRKKILRILLINLVKTIRHGKYSSKVAKLTKSLDKEVL